MSDSALELLEENIEDLIEANNIKELAVLLKETHPADIAFLFPRFDKAEQQIILDLLESEQASDVLVELDDHAQEKVLKSLDDNRIAELVDELDSDEAADVLASVEPGVAEKVLEILDRATREEVQQLMEYDEDTAGGIMSTDLVAVRDDMTVSEAVLEIRRLAEEVDDVYRVWVVDKYGIFKGLVSLKNLVIASPKTKISSITDTDTQVVNAEMDQETVVHMMKRYDLVSIPVVDKAGHLLGRVTWDDAMEVMDEESSEDLGYISGTGEEEPSVRSVFKSSRERLPWLAAGLIGGITSAIVISNFVHSLQALITLAFFIPIITGMGGNVGIQVSSLVVRGLATGEISFQDTGHRILKELGVALFNGLILSTILAAIIWFWQGVAYESLVISFSLLVVIIVATVIGVTVPLFLKRINIDPALAMGPFVTISNDIVGVFIYLTLATWLLMN